MQPDELFKVGRFPVLCGPDRADLALGIVEPVAVGTVRQVSFRIQTSLVGNVTAVRGRVVGIESGVDGHGSYDVTVEHFDGSYALVRGYQPQRRHCLSLTWSDRFNDVLEALHERATNRAASWDLDRADILAAIVLMGYAPLSIWSTGEGLFRVNLKSRGESVELMLSGHPRRVYRAQTGSIEVCLTGVMSLCDSGDLAIQLTDRNGEALHGLVDPDGALQWVHLGSAWWHTERLAS